MASDVHDIQLLYERSLNDRWSVIIGCLSARKDYEEQNKTQESIDAR